VRELRGGVNELRRDVDAEQPLAAVPLEPGHAAAAVEAAEVEYLAPGQIRRQIDAEVVVPGIRQLLIVFLLGRRQHDRAALGVGSAHEALVAEQLLAAADVLRGGHRAHFAELHDDFGKTNGTHCILSRGLRWLTYEPK
jgi:hypothetical protein